ncbi:MAG: hypothetical protein PHQ43_13380, partial [Dehalococcoidales bacterium]|nr:hypothetical protein [Dehalococcoidales bacterium]
MSKKMSIIGVRDLGLYARDKSLNLYEWLWRRIGGRPWAYIIRDSYHAHPYLWVSGVVLFGILL